MRNVDLSSLSRPDSPSWTASKAAGDRAELAVAAWFQSKGFLAMRVLGQAAGLDLRLQMDVEIKHDLQAPVTRNVAVEVAYNCKPSGIVTTAAAYWCFVVGDEGFVFRVDALRRLVNSRTWPEVDAGDGHKARCRLVPVEELRKAKGVQTFTLPGGADGN